MHRIYLSYSEISVSQTVLELHVLRRAKYSFNQQPLDLVLKCLYHFLLRFPDKLLQDAHFFLYC